MAQEFLIAVAVEHRLTSMETKLDTIIEQNSQHEKVVSEVKAWQVDHDKDHARKQGFGEGMLYLLSGAAGMGALVASITVVVATKIL